MSHNAIMCNTREPLIAPFSCWKGGVNIKTGLPDLNLDDFGDVGLFICAFYQALGWNPKAQELDPRRIKIHPEIWQHHCEQITKKWGVKAGLAWMNYGPSEDSNLDKTQVRILKGAMEDVGHIPFSPAG